SRLRCEPPTRIQQRYSSPDCLLDVGALSLKGSELVDSVPECFQRDLALPLLLEIPKPLGELHLGEIVGDNYQVHIAIFQIRACSPRPSQNRLSYGDVSSKPSYIVLGYSLGIFFLSHCNSSPTSLRYLWACSFLNSVPGTPRAASGYSDGKYRGDRSSMVLTSFADSLSFD